VEDALLNQFESFKKTQSFARVVPFAVEASWTTNNWSKLEQIVDGAANKTSDFNVGVGTVLQALHQKDHKQAITLIAELRLTSAASLSATSASSLQSCHDVLLRLHVLEDLESISFAGEDTGSVVHTNLGRRIQLIGADVSTKQYLLSLQRAAMALSPLFTDLDVASGWLTTAKLARKSSLSNQAFNAILHATALGEDSATIEHAKLMWRDGHHRKAIHSLESAIESGAFVSHNFDTDDMTLTSDQIHQQNVVVAKAHLMLAKWLDSAGQTQSDVIKRQYRKATEFHKKWDKGWYYLGKHYNKILDSEKSKPVGKEAQSYLTGEASKLVIENYLRALSFGSKYVFQTLPKVLTLWLELVAAAEQPQDARRGNEKFTAHLAAQRKKVVEDTNAQVKKYLERLQPVMLYTILSQVVARIGHSNKTVTDILIGIVVRVLKSFPQQAIWTVLALAKSSSKDRASRGITILIKVVEVQRKSGRDASTAELSKVIQQGQKLSDELLRIADHELKDAKATHVSLSKDLKFNHKIAPCRVVVPIETCLIPSMPNSQSSWPPKNFRAFSREPVTIAAFLDDALVLSSLQKPRKLSIRGSDGKLYAVLAKPKDDLRKDQRLMEFNTMINRFLKRDVEASKRRLYIRTYAVVPLNEECGLIEWVNNLKTFRDILISLYKERGINPNYTQIRALLDEACNCAPEKTAELFESRILTLFPAMFHDWFVETFPEPSAWFSARLRYTRSCAVMSIVGHVLGLGDRHGENILFEEDNGGTLHVDFNCLFDKGLTFEKPEMVPFRLTHNMVDAFGAYGYDGPFRRCCEITLTLLRGNEDALMTILETFLYDPTTDFIGGKKKRTHPNVPNTPQEVLEGVRSKTRGMLDGESVPLSVGGYVEQMIERATDRNRLARMYIGWCAFF
jgi:serine/threonine-protein kinase ATR